MTYQIPTCRKCGVQHWRFNPCPEDGQPDRLLTADEREAKALRKRSAARERMKGPQILWRSDLDRVIKTGPPTGLSHLSPGKPRYGKVNHRGLARYETPEA